MHFFCAFCSTQLQLGEALITQLFDSIAVPLCVPPCSLFVYHYYIIKFYHLG